MRMDKHAVLTRLAHLLQQGKDREELLREARRLARMARLERVPSLLEALPLIDWKHANPEEIFRRARIKPVRSLSGIQTLAVMLPPLACSHGGCIYCPGGPRSVYGSVPQSYTGHEPASMRAKRFAYDAFLQAFARLVQYARIGHPPSKLDVIIMGGTFTDYPPRVREAFITDVYRAILAFSTRYSTHGKLDYARFFHDITWEEGDTEAFTRFALRVKQSLPPLPLDELKRLLEHATVRVIGVSIETRPEMVSHAHARELRRLGVTRVELGMQHDRDTILALNGRPHTHADTLRAVRILREHGFKLVIHVMPGLPGSSMEEDERMLNHLFSREGVRPDMLKIYPTMVFPGTRLYDWYVQGEYTPLREEELIPLLARFKKTIPPVVRIMRVQRDIPPSLAVAGVRISNLRQRVHAYMHEHGWTCQCIRCRQAREHAKGRFIVRSYPLPPGEEYFISYESDKGLHGFLRLNVTRTHAYVRELHVYGQALPLHEREETASQHKGIGTALLRIAEHIAWEHGVQTIRIISGIGVRAYYAKHGYALEDEDMVKHLPTPPRDIPPYTHTPLEEA